VTAVFAAEAGWPYGEVKDTDSIFEKEKEKQLRVNPVREVSSLS